MWRPIQIELQSIDIKDCDLKRDLSTVLLSITDIDPIFLILFLSILARHFHSCIRLGFKHYRTKV